jgi:hypothetical protein
MISYPSCHHPASHRRRLLPPHSVHYRHRRALSGRPLDHLGRCKQCRYGYVGLRSRNDPRKHEDLWTFLLWLLARHGATIHSDGYPCDLANCLMYDPEPTGNFDPEGQWCLVRLVYAAMGSAIGRQERTGSDHLWSRHG